MRSLMKPILTFAVVGFLVTSSVTGLRSGNALPTGEGNWRSVASVEQTHAISAIAGEGNW